MSPKQKKNLIIIVLSMSAIAVHLFWPLADSEKFKIEWDQEMIDFKQDYLANLSISDSVKRPNIIIMMADDLGKGEVSIYGHSRVPTPNIDAIGNDGVTFTEGYITSPICSPSRAGLLTGRYQQRFGFEVQPHDRYPRNMLEFLGFKYFVDTNGWNLPDLDEVAYPDQENIDKQGLPPSEITIAELLKPLGYKTGLIGKWHLGYGDHSVPHTRGFDYSYSFYEAFTWYVDDVEKPEVKSIHHDLFIDPYIWDKKRIGTCAIRRNGDEIIEEEYLKDKFANEAVDFIERNKDQPFLLYVPFNAPHTPFQVTKKYYDRFPEVEDENKRIYYAMISAMDDAVGAIHQKIKDEGLEENTMIFFLSDNGGATYTKATINEPLKGGKMSDFEGGLNVPFLMKWKGRIEEGKVYEHPVSSVDVLSTSIAPLGIDLPNDRVYDGVNLVEFVKSDSLGSAHESIYWRAEYNRVIRKGDWKLVMNDLSGYELLYNLKSDKEEQQNVFDSYPDVVTNLKRDYENWASQLAKPLWPMIMDYTYEIDGEEYTFSN
ncbi:MAG: sulfatase-like hydrolase/transferase [Cyclobacteriaceae bacterium]